MHGFIVSLWNTAVQSVFSLIIFTVPQTFIITALWSRDCSPVSNIKNPSEESSWSFPSMHGILASQFSLILVTLRVEIPQVVLWKYLVSMNKKMVREFLPSNSFCLFPFFLSLEVTRSKHLSYAVGESSPRAVNGSWWCGREPVAGTQNSWIKAASLQVHI